jgi:hypothetical protein
MYLQTPLDHHVAPMPKHSERVIPKLLEALA